MAGREDDKERSKQSDYLNRLLYEVGSLRFHMRNNDHQMSELLVASTAAEECKSTETSDSPSKDLKSENMGKEYILDFLSDKLITEAINRCNGPMEGASFLPEHLKVLQQIEADLRKKVDEMSHRSEECLSQLINSCEL